MALIIFEVALVTHNILDVNKKFWIVKNHCSYSGPLWAQDVEESGSDILSTLSNQDKSIIDMY